MGDKNWYTNKDLFEEILEMQKGFRDMRIEMKETRTMIRQYNGLREEIEVVRREVDDMRARTEGRQSVGKAIREWGGWLVAILALVIAFL